jgi:hypothetical protein
LKFLSPFDLSGYDGLCIRMRSAENLKYKFNVQDSDDKGRSQDIPSWGGDAEVQADPENW